MTAEQRVKYLKEKGFLTRPDNVADLEFAEMLVVAFLQQDRFELIYQIADLASHYTPGKDGSMESLYYQIRDLN